MTNKFLLALTTLLALTACKKPQDKSSSEIASVDMIMKETVDRHRSNSCGMDGTTWLDATKKLRKNKEADKDAKTQVFNRTMALNLAGGVSEDDVYGVLTAIPDPMHKAFFQTYHGVLDIRGDAQTFCTTQWKKQSKDKVESLSADQEERLKDLQGCWMVENVELKDKDGKALQRDGKSVIEPRATIYITSDLRLVQNTVLPLFAFFYAEYHIDRIAKLLEDDEDIPKADKQKAVDEAKEFRAARTNLATNMVAYLKEYDAKQAKEKKADDTPTSLLSMYKKFFDVDEKDDATEADKSNTALAANSGFGNFVFAETVDSRYCSPETDAVLKGEDYKTLASAFAPMEKYFGAAWFDKAE